LREDNTEPNLRLSTATRTNRLAVVGWWIAPSCNYGWSTCTHLN